MFMLKHVFLSLRVTTLTSYKVEKKKLEQRE